MNFGDKAPIKICYCLLFLTLISLRSFSQRQALSLSGKVIDRSSGAGLEFVNASLYNQKDMVLVKGLTTGQGGTFQFSGLPSGSYMLRLTMVGYVPDTLRNILIESGKLKKITRKLKPDPKMLNAVVITDTKPEVQFGADTITYNVGSSILSEGSTASDILKNVPMVDVDIDGKVSIAGKRNTRIFINGKPSDYMASNMADLLSVLPSEAIEKVEVINNPDVRYSSDGEGIINIVLKKGYKIGLNGTLSVSAGTLGNYTGTGYLAYRTQTLALSSSYGYRNTLRDVNSTSLTQNFKEDVISSYRNRYNDGSTTVSGHNLRSGLDWDINPKSNLTINLNGNLNNNDGASSSDDQRLNAQSITQEIRSQANTNNTHGSSLILDADYTWKFGDKKKNDKLEIGFISSLNNSEQLRVLERNTTRPSTGNLINPFLQHNQNEEGNSGIVFNTDYSRSLTKLTSLSFGLQGSFKVNRNEQDVREYDFTAAQDTSNPYLTNQYRFFEKIYSGYAGYNLRTKKKWSFRVGGRAELTDVRFEQERSGDASMKPYFNFFPNLGISKTFKKKYITGVNYSVRINRPRDYALNPLVNNSDSTNISYGNPGLKPSVTNQVELSFSTFEPKWTFSPRIGYSTTRDIIERVRIPVDDNGNVETTYQNLASSDVFSLNLFGNYKPTKKITLNGGFSLSKISYRSSGSAVSANRGGLSYRGNMALALKLPQKIAFEGNLSYYNNASAQGRSKASLTSGFGARKLFLNNKLVVRTLINDPFNQKSNTEIIEGLNYYQQRFVSQATRNFSLSLSYRFTKTGRNTVNKQKKDPNEKGDKVLEAE